MIEMASAISVPFARAGNVIRFEKEGTLHLILKGVSLSSLTI